MDQTFTDKICTMRNSFPPTDPTVSMDQTFTDKMCTIRNSLPPTNPTVSVDQTSYSGKFLQTFSPVTEQVVLEILQKAAPKACDLDPIPTKLLYENLDILLPTITNIINTSLASGAVSPDLKTAFVKPC